MRVKHFPTRNKFPHIPNNVIQTGIDDNNFEYDANPEWIPVSGVANNEIWILAFDGSADVYSAFICTVANSGTYNMDIIGGVDGTTVLSTYGATASGTQVNFQIPNGTGKYCSDGYYTYKLRIYATVATNSILSFVIQIHSPTNALRNCWKIINFGTRDILNVTCGWPRPWGQASVVSPYLLYANTYYCSKVTTISFYSSVSLKKATLAKNMNSATNLGFYSTYVSGGIFGECASLETVTMPENMSLLEYTGGNPNNYSAFTNCSNLTVIKGMQKLPNIKGLLYTYQGCTLLTEVPTLSVCNTLSIAFSSIGIRVMTIFNQPLLRCASFVLTGTSNTIRSNLSSIEIDWANSQFTGNIDIRYNNLSAVELDRIFTELPTLVTTKTIYVASNVGSASCTPSIATAKNWTVVTA